MQASVLPLLRVVPQRTLAVFLRGRPCASHDVRCRFNIFSADIVPPRRFRVGQKLGKGVFTDDGFVPGLKFFLGLPVACGFFKLVQHGPLDGSVHPTVVDRWRNVFCEVAAIPPPQHVHVHPSLIGKCHEHTCVGCINWRMVVQLDGLGVVQGPIVLGRGQCGHDRPCPRVARVVMARDVDAVVGGRRIVCGTDKPRRWIDRLGVDVEAVPRGDIEIGVGAVERHFGVQAFWANWKLGACPPCDVSVLVAVHHVQARRMDQRHIGFETLEPLLS